MKRNLCIIGAVAILFFSCIFSVEDKAVETDTSGNIISFTEIGGLYIHGRLKVVEAHNPINSSIITTGVQGKLPLTDIQGTLAYQCVQEIKEKGLGQYYSDELFPDNHIVCFSDSEVSGTGYCAGDDSCGGNVCTQALYLCPSLAGISC